jgi:hypothetical protein
MIRREGRLVFVSLRYMLAPALLMHVDSALSAVVNMSFGFLATDGAFHDPSPPVSFAFYLSSSGLALFLPLLWSRLHKSLGH